MYEFNLSLKFLSSTSSLSPWLIHPCYRERVIFIIELLGKQMKKKTQIQHCLLNENVLHNEFVFYNVRF